MNYKLLVDITDYIILYPIRWYNFIKRVIASSTVYNNILIITKKNIIDVNTLNDIINILVNNKIIIECSENIDFLIYYFKDYKHPRLFIYWLNLISLRATVDIFKEVKCEDPLFDNFFIVVGNNKIIVSNNPIFDNCFYISLKKSNKKNVIVYNYSYFTFRNEIELKIKQYDLQNNKNPV